MGNVAVLASGNGSNFEAIVEGLANTPHRVCLLVGDRRNAAVFDRAKRLSIPAYHVSYHNRERYEAETDIARLIDEKQPDLVALAGFMRILSASFVDRFAHKIVNIHPTLLPEHPGAHGLKECYRSGSERIGITVHFVDHGVDTGPIIRQESLVRSPDESFESVERRIHALEHRVYPAVIRDLLASTATDPA